MIGGLGPRIQGTPQKTAGRYSGVCSHYTILLFKPPCTSAFPSKVLGVGCWVLGFATAPAQHPTPNTRAESALARREGTDSQMMAMCITDIARALDRPRIWYLKHQGIHRRLKLLESGHPAYLGLVEGLGAQQSCGEGREAIPVLREQFAGLGIAFVDDLACRMIDRVRGPFAIGATIAADQPLLQEIAFLCAAQRQQPNFLAHPEACHHRACQLGCLLDIVLRAGRYRTEQQLFGHPAAERIYNACSQVGFAVVVPIVIGHRQGHAESLATWYDRHATHRVALALEQSQQRMPRLVDRDPLAICRAQHQPAFSA